MDEVQDDQASGLDERERAELTASVKRLRKQGDDEEVVARLAADNFTGRYYRTVMNDLAAYAFPVLMSWLRRGLIFQLTAERHRPVAASDATRVRLATVQEERRDLANDTIALGTRMFVRYGLREKKWSAAGGASLRTYFVGVCLNAFPNAYRHWLADQNKLNLQEDFLVELDDRVQLLPAHDGNPVDIVIARSSVQEELARLDPELREVLARMAITGESRAESARHLKLSERAMEGKLRRLRQVRKQRKLNSRRRGSLVIAMFAGAAAALAASLVLLFVALDKPAQDNHRLYLSDILTGDIPVTRSAAPFKGHTYSKSLSIQAGCTDTSVVFTPPDLEAGETYLLRTAIAIPEDGEVFDFNYRLNVNGETVTSGVVSFGSDPVELSTRVQAGDTIEIAGNILGNMFCDNADLEAPIALLDPYLVK